MIIAGEQIDCTLGVKFGLSTMAAAGIGNTISDVVGISLGEVIEAGVSRFLKAPRLQPAQLDLRVTRIVKGSANAIGITIGCIIGMVPLLWIDDRKSVFFDDDEQELYQMQFAKYGVSPQQFFNLVQSGKWHTVEEGTTLVRQGDPLGSTMFILSGSAHGKVHGDAGGSKVVAIYEGRTDEHDVEPALSHMTRGCIIGGSALVDPDLAKPNRPYPNTVIVTRRTKYLEWKTDDLRALMKEDKSVEAAVLNTLYLDLVRGIREQRRKSVRGGPQLHSSVTGAALPDETNYTRDYEVMMRVVVADGVVHPLEKSMLTEFARRNRISRAAHADSLRKVGWTPHEWERGVKTENYTVRHFASGAGEPPAPPEAAESDAGSSPAPGGAGGSE